MHAQTRVGPWWAALTVWGVVNAVNVLQAAGFLSWVYTGSRTINHLLGYGMMALAVPATLALVAFWRARAGCLSPRRLQFCCWGQWVLRCTRVWGELSV